MRQTEHPHTTDRDQEAAPPRPARLHEAIIACYPRAWRERYGDEMADLLAREARSPRLALDLARGAIDARLWPQLGQGVPTRVRRAVGITLLAAALLAAGYGGQHPATARALAALAAPRHVPAGVATATLTEYGHASGDIRPE